MSLHTWWLFVLMTFVVSATPGPNMLLVLSNSARFGLRAAMATVVGCMTSLLTVMSISAAGLADKQPTRLEDLPNIGKSIAADLRSLGILSPEQLGRQDPLVTYRALAAVMGKRLDPCVLYVLMAVAHFQKTGEVLPWWYFTALGKKLL